MSALQVAYSQRSGSTSRIGGLDGLRGLAVLLVLVFHISGSLLPSGGAVGVTTFFVLSGYLITSLLIREHESHGRLDLKAFYIRRALRLYPALLALLVTLGVSMFVFANPNVSTYLPKALVAGLYLSDFAPMAGFGMGVLTHTWSLAVEEQFYLVWPVVLIGLFSLSRGKAKRIIMLVSLVFVAALVWRVSAQISLDPIRVYYAPDTNFFAMLGGAALASVRNLPRLPAWIGWVALAALLALAVSRPVLGIDREHFIGWVVLGAALVGVMVVWAASQGSLRVLEVSAARWFGGISYSLYLWHDPLLKMEYFNAGVPEGIDRMIVASISVLVAWISWRLVERPALSLKKKFERSTIR